MVVHIIILCILLSLYVTHRVEDYIVLKNINKDNPISDRLVDIFTEWGLVGISAWTVWKCIVVTFLVSLSSNLIGELNFGIVVLDAVLVVGGVLPSILVLDKIGNRLLSKKGDR